MPRNTLTDPAATSATAGNAAGTSNISLVLSDAAPVAAGPSATASAVAPAAPAAPAATTSADGAASDPTAVPAVANQPWLGTGAADASTVANDAAAQPDMAGGGSTAANGWLTRLMTSLQSQAQPAAAASPSATSQPAVAPASAPAAAMPAVQPAIAAVPAATPVPLVQPAATQPTSQVAAPAAPPTPVAQSTPVQPLAVQAAPVVVPPAAGQKSNAPATTVAATPSAGTPIRMPKAPGARPTQMVPFKISSYAGLQQNKGQLAAALTAAGATADEKRTLTAIAMQETNTMDVNQNDRNKQGSAANFSIFNANLDMLRTLGFTGDPAVLNTPAGLKTTVQLMLKGIRTWGTTPFLNFLRGGSTGFDDGVSYKCAEYRNAIATIKNQLQLDPALMTDDRRVEIDVSHQ